MHTMAANRILKYCPGLQIEARQAQGCRGGGTPDWYHQTLNGRLPLEDSSVFDDPVLVGIVMTRSII